MGPLSSSRYPTQEGLLPPRLATQPYFDEIRQSEALPASITREAAQRRQELELGRS